MTPSTTFTSAVELRVRVCGNGLAPADYSPTIPNNVAAPGGIPTPVALVEGPNELAVPAGAANFMIVSPTASTNAKSVTSSSSPTNGVPFTNQVVLLPVAGQSSVWVQSAAVEAVLVAWF